MSDIALYNVKKDYAGTAVLTNINFQMRPFELAVIAGCVGCGKSSLLKVIAGIEPVSSGQVVIGQKSNAKKLKYNNCAMVFTKPSLFDKKTVFYNLAYGLKLRKVKKSEIFEKVNLVCEILDIKDILYKKVKTLSHDLKQLIAAARALIRNPDVILLDEPFYQNFEKSIQSLNKLIKRFPATCILSAHSFKEALYLNKRTFILREGIIYQEGMPPEIMDRPCDLETAKFIEYNVNVFDCTVENEILSFLNFKFKIPPKFNGVVFDKKEYYVAIMPQDISLKKDENNLKLCGDITAFLEDYILSISGAKFVIKSKSKINAGKNELFIDINNIHLFKKDTKINVLK